MPRAINHDPWSISSCSKLTWEVPGGWGNLSGTRVLPTEQGTPSPNGNASRGRNCDPCTKGPLQGCPSQLEGAGRGSWMCFGVEPPGAAPGAQEKGSDGSEVTSCLGCYVTLLLLMCCHSGLGFFCYLNQSGVHRQRKKKKNGVENVQLQFRQCFSWLILPFSTPIITRQVSTPTWAGCSPGIPGLLFPKRAACLWGEPSCHSPGTQQGGVGAPPPLIELGPIQTQIKGSIHSHAPGCKMITPRSQSRIFPQSWGIPWEFPAVWDICC